MVYDSFYKSTKLEFAKQSMGFLLLGWYFRSILNCNRYGNLIYYFNLQFVLIFIYSYFENLGETSLKY